MTLGYEVSILGMLAAPFLIVSVIGFLLWRSSRAPRPGTGSQSLGGPRGPR
jgi:hypothetical protein